MKALFPYLVLFAGQTISHKELKVVHLQPQHSFITGNFGGKLLELINAPAVVYLPESIPKLDSEGRPWQVEIKNAGPGPVAITGKSGFKVMVEVGRTIHIAWNGSTYSLQH